ncbi:MAG: class I SAM-dependent methyltransferase [Solirubrobacteraceae bacterium]
MRPQLARELVTALLRQVRDGRLTIIEAHGERLSFGQGEREAVMQLHSPRVWADFLGGSLRLADSYAQGRWDSPDTVALVRLAARNMSALDRVRRLGLPLLYPLALARAVSRPAKRDQRRRDVSSHYDLGNALFERMLDPTLTYSCALFTEPGSSLEDAQRAKLERVCAELELGPEHHVLEIGTGWGSFAIHAASTRGCRVTTTTVSGEQYKYVRARIKALGLSELVSVISEDFRDLKGTYDRLVSIEMIEAVGWQNIGRFLGACSSFLTAGGAMLLQAITIDDRAYQVEKASRSFIKRYIFPGGTLPSVQVLTGALARRTDMQTMGVTDLTAHYVTTLQHWRRRFLANWPELAAQGFDERFKRIWALYLAYCEAGFAERRIQDVQMLLVKPGFRRQLTRLQTRAPGKGLQHAF